jgi:hypothetical protein
MRLGDEPIHPMTITTVTDTKMEVPQKFIGLTKREYFAAMAMQGMVSSAGDIETNEYYANRSLELANTLIAELEATK